MFERGTDSPETREVSSRYNEAGGAGVSLATSPPLELEHREKETLLAGRAILDVSAVGPVTSQDGTKKLGRGNRRTTPHKDQHDTFSLVY
jgi:hypothetical protein